MRLEHHLVGGYVRYISPHILLLLLLLLSKFTVESDHKPLENIQYKSMANTPPRLQRMMLRLQPYDYNIVYRPGREMVLADALSRLDPTRGPPLIS